MNQTGQYMLTTTVWPTPSIFYWNFTGEKVSKYTKTKYSDVHSEECMQHKCGKRWDLIDIEAFFFIRCMPIIIKCVARINHYRKGLG